MSLAAVGGADAFFARAWPSYLTLLAIQAKILWRAWDFRDLTGGDTSAYFRLARAWAERLQLDIAWSPLYTAFFGSMLSLTEDPYSATIVHRLAIVVLAGAGVLFVLRRLLEPSIALLAAVYWTSWPIVFETLYEVHLFALLPILVFWMVALTNDSAPGRVAAVMVVAGATVLVRNEFSVAAITAAGLAMVFGRRSRSEDLGQRRIQWRGAAVTALAVAALVGSAYQRSLSRFPQLSQVLSGKHRQNMCQVYAFGYQQRHPQWRRNPWTECRDLAESTFGEPLPTFRRMVATNPRAVSEHMAWNLRLVPAGLQVLLFSATSTDLNPDYPQPPVRRYPRTLSWLALALFLAAAAGARRLYRTGLRLPAGLVRRVVFAAAPPLAMAIPVALTQRPRPSYFFYVGVVLIAAAGWCLAILLALLRRGRAVSRLAALLAAILTLALVPSHYVKNRSHRPLRRDVERLLPHASTLAALRGALVLGDQPGEVAGYLNLPQSNAAWEGTGRLRSTGIWARRKRGEPLREFLDRQGVVAFYLDTGDLANLRRQRGSRRLLDHPERVGWRRVAGGHAGSGPWVLMVRSSTG